MKAFGKILLIVVLTLITAAACVFGYFFFAGKDYYDFVDEPNTTLTLSEAKELVAKAIEDINKIGAGASGQSATLSADYDYSDKYEDHDSESFISPRPVVDIKVYLKALKFVLNDENVKENKNYISRYNSSGEYDANGEYSITLSFKIINNSIELQINNDTNSDINNAFVIKLFKDLENEGAWALDSYVKWTQGNTLVASSYTKCFAKDSKVYRISQEQYKNEDSSILYGVSNIIMDHDINSKKLLYVTPTDAEEIAALKNRINEKFEEVTFKDWTNAAVIDFNFMDSFNEDGDHGSF